MWKKRDERPNVGGVSIRSRNGAPSRKGCVVNGQMTYGKQQMTTPSPGVELCLIDFLQTKGGRTHYRIGGFEGLSVDSLARR